jgi:hypothetical protein
LARSPNRGPTTACCAQRPSAGTRLRTPQITFCDAQLWFAEGPVKMKADYSASGELGTLLQLTARSKDTRADVVGSGRLLEEKASLGHHLQLTARSAGTTEGRSWQLA